MVSRNTVRFKFLIIQIPDAYMLEKSYSKWIHFMAKNFLFRWNRSNNISH